MIAEINNKLTTGEDELTGNFFGSMRYLGFKDFLIPILMETSHSENDIVKAMLKNEEFNEETFEFWKRDKLGEIDCYFDNDKVGIGIEVKLDSELSSEDQLLREAEMLNSWSKEKEKALLFIARNKENCIGPYKKNCEKCREKNVVLAWISWQDIYNEILKIHKSIKANKKNDNKQILLLEDLKNFLYKKGFDSFQSFLSVSKEHSCNEGQIFTFIYNAYKSLNFVIKDVIKENDYYEFR